MNRLAVAVFVLVLLAAAAAALFLGGDDVKAGDTAELAAGGAASIVAGAEALTESAGGPSDRQQSTGKVESAPAPAGQSPEEIARSPLIFRGIILDSTRQPMRGAEVTATRLGGGSKPLSEKTLSGEDGRFVLGVSERQGWSWRIEARAGGLAPSYLDNVPAWLPDVDVGPIVLYAPTSVHGVVADRDGRPLAGARIYVHVVSSPEEYEDDELSTVEVKPSTVTGPDGKYTVASLPPGKVSLGAEAAGYADSVRPGILLTLDHANEANFTLLPEEPLKGSVVDENGSAVPKAKVRGRIQNARHAFWRRAVESDSQGKFLLNGLDRSRRQLMVQIQKAGYSAVWQDGNHLPADERYVLRKGAVVVVKLDAAGASQVPALKSVRFERRNSRTNKWNGWGEVPKSQREVVDPSQWRVTTEMRGATRVVAFAEDGSSGTSGEFEIPQGALTTPVEVGVRVQAPGTAAGRVTAVDLTPVAGVRVEYASQERGAAFLRVVTSDDKGAFVFEGVPPGNGTLTLRSPDWISEPLKVETRSGERTDVLELTARKPSKISGRLTIGDAPPGEAVPILFYKVVNNGNDSYWNLLGLSTANEKGEYSFAPAPAGRIAVAPKRKIDSDAGSVRSFENERQHPEWNDEERNRWQWIVDVAPESEAKYDLNLPLLRPSVLRGQVLVNGEPRSGIDLWLYSDRGGDWRGDTTNAEGKFKFKIDTAGEYQVQLWGDGFNEMRKVSMGEGDERDLTIQLSAGGVEGTICDPASQGLSLRVRLERQREKNANPETYWYYETPEQLTKADGTYAFTEAVAGSYRVVVEDYRRKYATMASSVFTIGPKERLTVPQIRVPLAAPIVVNVKNTDGKPVNGNVRVTAAPGSAPLARGSAGVNVRQGTGRVQGVRPGQVIVKFQPSGPYQPAAEQTVNLPSDGSETVVTFEVKRKEGAPNTDDVNGQSEQMQFFNDGSQMFFNSNGDFGNMIEWDYEELDGVKVIHGAGGGG